MLLNTIDTSSMHSISSLLDTITHLTPGAQRKARGDDLAAERRQRIVRERETERERERESERKRERERQRERERDCVSKRKKEREGEG